MLTKNDVEFLAEYQAMAGRKPKIHLAWITSDFKTIFAEFTGLHLNDDGIYSVVGLNKHFGYFIARFKVGEWNPVEIDRVGKRKRLSRKGQK